MKIHEIKTYDFDELSDKAKERALEDLRQTEREAGNPWTGEICNTWEALEKLFNVRAEYDRGLSVKFIDWYDEALDFTGARALSFIWNHFGNAIFTGRFYSKCGFKADGSFVSKKRHSKILLTPDNCPLTGVCYDMDALDGMVNFMRGKMTAWEYKNTSVEDLIRGCFYDLAKAEERGLKELIEANEWEYLEDGRQF